LGKRVLRGGERGFSLSLQSTALAILLVQWGGISRLQNEWLYVLNHVKLIKPFFYSLLSHSGMALAVKTHTLEEDNLCKFLKLKKTNTLFFLFSIIICKI
jgi:hypothetical protein